MKLEVEEDIEATPDYVPDELRPRQGEQFLADLYPAFLRIQLVEQAECGFLGIEIHGDDDWFFQDNFPGLSDGLCKLALASPIEEPLIK